MAKPKLTLKQQRFAQVYARTGNGTEAARVAGYRDGPGISVTASRQLRKAHVAAGVERELKDIARDFSPDRVRRRLDQISHRSEDAGQFGPAVRCEELLGKAAGMWVEQSINLHGQLNDTHIAALIDVARKRQQEPIDLSDDGHSDGHSSDDE